MEIKINGKNISINGEFCIKNMQIGNGNKMVNYFNNSEEWECKYCKTANFGQKCEGCNARKMK